MHALGLHLSHHENSYEQVYNGAEKHHKGSITHEVLAGAVAFEAMRAYEKKQKAEGKEVHHG